MKSMNPKVGTHRANSRSKCAPNEEARKHYISEHKDINHELYFIGEEIKHMMSAGFRHTDTELIGDLYHVRFTNPESGEKKELKIQYQENFNHLEPLFSPLKKKH